MKKSLALFALANLCARGGLMAQDQPAPKSSFPDIILLFVVPFIVIFYVFFIRPQKKEQKKKRDMLDAVAKGDRVTTIGGIMGRVSNIANDVVTIQIDEKNDVKMKVLKRAISGIKGKTEDDSDDSLDQKE